MPVDERHRLALHEAAKQSWGPNVAATLLEMLPPAGWGDVATRQQLQALEDRLSLRIESVEDRLTNRIESVEDRLTNRIESVEVRIESVEHKLRAELAESLLRMQRWTVGTILASSAGVVAAVALLTR